MRARTFLVLVLSIFLFGFSIVSYLFFFKTSSNIISPLPAATHASISKRSNTPTPTAIPTPTHTPTPVLPTPTPTPRIVIAPPDLEQLFTKLSSEYSVDKELLKRIAQCESGLNPGASTSRYVGLYQFSESLWVSTRNLMGHNSDIGLRVNSEEAIRTAAFMVAQGNLHIWPNCNK